MTESRLVMQKQIVHSEDYLRNLLFGIYTAILIATYSIQYFLHPIGSLVGDSYLYGFGNEPNFKLLSFTGHAVRNWPIVLVNLLSHNLYVQTFIQIAYATFAWILTLQTFKKLFSGIASIICAFLLLGFSLSPQIVNFHSTLLAESYALSTLLITLNFISRYLCNKTRLNFYFAIAFLLLWSMLRSRNTFFALIILITLLFTYRQSGVGKNIITISAICTLVIGWALIVSSNQVNQMFDKNITYKQMATYYTFAAQPEAANIRAEILKIPEMQCMKDADFTDVIKLSQSTAAKCKESSEWLRSDFDKWYFKYLILHPSTTFRMVSFGLIVGNNESDLYSGTFGSLPELSNLFFGNRIFRISNSALTKLDMDPNKVIFNTPLVAWLIIYLYLIYALLKKTGNVRNKTLILVISTIGSIGILMMCANVLVNPAEYLKMTIQGFQTLIFSIMTLACLVFEPKLTKSITQNQ